MTEQRAQSAPTSPESPRCVNSACAAPLELTPRCAHCGCAARAGTWTIDTLVAQSAHSRVYQAHDALGRTVALKELHFALVPGAKELDAFEHEASTLASLQNAFIPRFVERFTEGSGVGLRLYLATEFVRGESLADRISRGPLPEADVIALGKTLLRVLVMLQQRSPALFHRDLKPANVMFREDGSVVLVDFGSSRSAEGSRTHRSTLVGTFGYMPPEQLGGTVDRTTDVFALAATLLHAVTARAPAELLGPDFTPTLPPGVSPLLAGWIKRALSFDPKRRFPNAATALSALEGTTPLTLAPPRAPAPRWQVALLAALVTLGVGLWTARALAPGEPEEPLVMSTQGWFSRVKAQCNQLEVGGMMARSPPPSTPEGRGDGAGCYALAGRFADARRLIETLPDQQARTVAAWRVFEIAHPVADQGDDAAAGPMMELVLQYWPDNYQALYHAGISEYAAGDPVKAKERLDAFLKLYTQPDHFTQTAQLVLDRIAKGLPADPGMGLGRH